jgi:hypothetical protein
MTSYSPRKSIIFEFRNHGDGKVINFIGALTKEFFLPMTPLKRFPWCQWHRWNLKQTLQVLFLPFKGKSSKNISMANIPILVQVLEAEKSWGLPRPHFRFQRCQWHSWNRFWRLSKRLSLRIRCHTGMQNGFSLLIKDIYGVDWWKSRESKISCNCPFKKYNFHINKIISEGENKYGRYQLGTFIVL